MVIDVAIPSNCNIRRKEHKKLEKELGKMRVCEGNSDAISDNSDWGTGGWNSQAGWMAPAKVCVCVCVRERETERERERKNQTSFV